jgi:Uma2 family endonuclease
MKYGRGIPFSSSAGFKLSTGADLAPDAAWVRLDRWNALRPEQQKKFAPLCPDFVVELRSESDNLATLQEKMREYQTEPDFQLGVLIDRKHKQVYVYRPTCPEICLTNINEVDCQPEMPGFVLKLDKIW